MKIIILKFCLNDFFFIISILRILDFTHRKNLVKANAHVWKEIKGS